MSLEFSFGLNAFNFSFWDPCILFHSSPSSCLWKQEHALCEQPQTAFTGRVQQVSEGQSQNNLEIKASSCHLLFSFPSFLPLMVHALCLHFHLLSSCLLSLSLPSLSAADMLVTLFCIFSPAACAGYPVWSNIPGGDRSKLPGKFVIFIKCVYFFPLFSCCWCGGFCCCGSSVLRNITSVPMFRHCVTSAWNSSEGLNNRLLGLQPEPPFEETHLCSEITFMFSKYGWRKWNQFMWCSSFFYPWCLFWG